MSVEVIPGVVMDSLMADRPNDITAPEPVSETKAKKKVTPRKKPVKKEAASPAEDGAEGDAEPTTPTPAKKTRKLAAKKTKAEAPATPAAEGDEAKGEAAVEGESSVKVPATKTPKKRAAPKIADGETPTKKAKATPAPKAAAKGAKASFPTSWDEFSDADKLIVTMRRKNNNWPEIDAELTKLTGNTPGKDVTRKRFAKLDAVATIFKDGDDALLAAAKVEVDSMIAEQIKSIQAGLWGKVAEAVIAKKGDSYKAAALEKKYESMVASGKINAAGEFIGAITAKDEEAANDADAEADTDMSNGNGIVAEEAKSEPEIGEKA